MTRTVYRITAVVLTCCGWLVADARGENVDLSTVPNRDTVQLTIYNSEDITLVRETRKISFKKGWQPAAVQLGQHADRSDLCATSVPDRPRQAGSSGHDVPSRQAPDAVLERG